MSIAGELITRGWKQGALLGDDGSVCLAGAAHHAAFGQLTHISLDQFPEGSALMRVVRDISARGVGDWNDDDERTFDEVLRVAKEADEILGAS